MKTVLIYDNVGMCPIEFAVLDGDYSHLNGIYINAADADEKLQDELDKLVYDDHALLFLSEFPAQAVKDGAIVIVAGFLP